MRREVSNKKIILFGLFALVVGVSIYFVVMGNNKYNKVEKFVSVNDTFEEYTEEALGDSSDGCSTYSYWYTKSSSSYTGGNCSATCSGSSCPSATSSSASSCVYCSSSGEDDDGKDKGTKYTCTKHKKCTSCNAGHYLSDGKCPEIKVGSVSGGGSKAYLAKGESATFSFSAKGDPSSASGFSPRWSVSPSGGASGSGSGASYTLTASGAKAGTGSSCATTTYTVKAESGGTSKTATAEVCVYCSAWKGPHTGKFFYKQKKNTSPTAAGCYYFVGEQAVEGGYSYTAYYTRCCGGSPPSNDLGACYGNKEYLGIASKADWLLKPTSELSHKYANVKSEDCHPINVSVCKVNFPNTNPQTVNTDICEDTKTISYKDTTECSNNDDSKKSNFYTIVCERSITTAFDYGDDNSTTTSRNLYRGQGFGFGIDVKSTHTCTAKFDKDAWLTVYNKFLSKIGFISSSLTKYVKNYDYDGWKKAVDALSASKETKSEVFLLWNIMEELKDSVVDGYIGFKPQSTYDEAVDFELSYSVKGKTEVLSDQFIQSEKDFKEGQYLRTLSEERYNLTEYSELRNIPAYYIMTNSSNPRVVKFIPKRTYIDRYIGKNLSDEAKGVDGGNKIYIDYNVDPTGDNKSYVINLKVSGLGTNKSSVINNKCDIKVTEEKLLYRSIDVTNPFINSSWDIGANWLNSRFSFTNTIKSNTWSLNSLYNIPLSGDDVSSLKESNKSNKELYPYLGLCDRLETYEQDSITKKICGILKNTID